MRRDSQLNVIRFVRRLWFLIPPLDLDRESRNECIILQQTVQALVVLAPLIPWHLILAQRQRQAIQQSLKAIVDVSTALKNTSWALTTQHFDVEVAR
jgi:hypothetical protein